MIFFSEQVGQVLRAIGKVGVPYHYLDTRLFLLVALARLLALECFL